MPYRCSICHEVGHNSRSCPQNSNRGRRTTGTRRSISSAASVRATNATSTRARRTPQPPPVDMSDDTYTGVDRGPRLFGKTKCPPQYTFRRGDRMRARLPAQSWPAPVHGQPKLTELPVHFQRLLTHKQVTDVMVGEVFRKCALGCVTRVQTVTNRNSTSAELCFHAFFSPVVSGYFKELINAHLAHQRRKLATADEIRMWIAIFMLRCVNNQTTQWVYSHYDVCASIPMTPQRFAEIRRGFRLLPPYEKHPKRKVRWNLQGTPQQTSCCGGVDITCIVIYAYCSL